MEQQSETLKKLKQYVKEQTANYAYYGLNIQVDRDDNSSTYLYERYKVTVSDDLYCSDVSDKDVIDITDTLINLFSGFMLIPADNYSRILKMRESGRIATALQNWPDNTYYYYDPQFEEDFDDDCPVITCYIDELQVTDYNIYKFLVHSIKLDENNNIKLVGRIWGDGHDKDDDELWTCLDSVYEFDLQYLLVPDRDMKEDLDAIGVSDVENEVDEEEVQAEEKVQTEEEESNG